MRLLHQYLINYLDNKRLLSQHCECCALRGKGWGKKHSVVDYVFTHSPLRLVEYHRLMMDEMHNRKYNVDGRWYSREFRGQHAKGPIPENKTDVFIPYIGVLKSRIKFTIYPEHDNNYLKECLLNLKAKGAELINGKTIDEMLIKCDLND